MAKLVASVLFVLHLFHALCHSRCHGIVFLRVPVLIVDLLRTFRLDHLALEREKLGHGVSLSNQAFLSCRGASAGPEIFCTPCLNCTYCLWLVFIFNLTILMLILL